MACLFRTIALAIFLFCLVCPAPAAAAESVVVVVSGLEDDLLNNAQEALALPFGLVREGHVDRLWLERFARQADAKVRSALEPFGYYDARVRTELEAHPGGEHRLRVYVEPGAPVLVTELEVAVRGAGAGEEPLTELVRRFPLKKGMILLQQPYEQAKGALKSRAEELGYLDADFPVHEIRIRKPEATARVHLVLDTGTRYYFDGVTIQGGEEYPEKFLRRFVTFKSGEPFSFAKLGESQLNFTNSERFKEVVVTPRKEAALNGLVPVEVRLSSSPRRHLRPGVGYGTDTGARFVLRFQDFNVLERGHEFNSILYLSQRLQGFVTGYIIPGSRDIKNTTGFQLNMQKEDTTTYSSELISLEGTQNRSFGRGRLGALYLRLQQEQYTIGSQDSSSRLILPGVRFSQERFDSMIRPQSGFHYGIDLRGTHTLLGSDTKVFQTILDGSYVQPLPWRLSLHARARGGLTLVSDPLRDLPPSLRFFAGGDQSVRGYAYQSLGPSDATGQVVGGKQLLTGSLELERALYQKWGVSVFWDTGNAANSFTNFTFVHGVGVGVHYYTPVGALNVSLARQVGVDNPSFRVHFTVGFEL